MLSYLVWLAVGTPLFAVLVGCHGEGPAPQKGSQLKRKFVSKFVWRFVPDKLKGRERKRELKPLGLVQVVGIDDANLRMRINPESGSCLLRGEGGRRSVP